MTMDEVVGKPCIQVLDEVIEDLVDFRLRLTGDSSLEDVWASDEPIKSDLFFRSKSEFDIGCKSLRTLKDLDKVLAPLSRPLSQKILEMEDALLRPSYYYGLASIPNETFMLIMDFLAVSCTRYAGRMKRIKNLSSVCKRFRDGVVNTSSFWIYWDNMFGLDDGFQHRLARAKEASLFVEIESRSDGTSLEKILTRILPHRNRWHQLRLTDWTTSEESITTMLPTADFPSVHSLKVECHCPFSGTEDLFFAKWTFPNVCSVKLLNMIPTPGAFPKATSLALCRERYSDGQYIPTLTRSLLTMPALLTLELIVSFIPIPSQPTESYTVELPSVITFQIRDHIDGFFEYNASNNLRQFTRALQLPNVEHYSLSLCFRAKEEEAWVTEIFPEGMSFRAVKDFHLSVTSTVPQMQMFTLFFDGFSSRFPNIRSLHVDRFRHEYGDLGDGSFHLAETFDALEGRLPLLRSLVVLELDNDWSVFLRWFESLREKGAMIDHLSVSEMVGNIDLGLFKRNNIDVELLRTTFPPGPSVEGSEESEESEDSEDSQDLEDSEDSDDSGCLDSEGFSYYD